MAWFAKEVRDYLQTLVNNDLTFILSVLKAENLRDRLRWLEKIE